MTTADGRTDRQDEKEHNIPETKKRIETGQPVWNKNHKGGGSHDQRNKQYKQLQQSVAGAAVRSSGSTSTKNTFSKMDTDRDGSVPESIFEDFRSQTAAMGPPPPPPENTSSGFLFEDR